MLILISYIFGFAVKVRNYFFDKGYIKSHKLDIPVISIGNLSVGGTGKSPFTIYLAKYLKSIGKKPGIVGSGYGRKSKGYFLVSDGQNIDTDAVKLGDEMIMVAQSTKCPVAIDDKKYKASIKLLKSHKIDCLIIDDGFQHRYLKRDLDIVLVDKKTENDKYLLPAGRLREPHKNLSRADIIAKKLDVNLSEYHIIYSISNFFIESKIGQKWNNQKVVLVTGIANSERVVDTVKSLNIKSIHLFTYKNHHGYTQKDIESIIFKTKKLEIDSILTTEKDFVKLFSFHLLFIHNEINLFTLNIENSILEGRETLENKIDEIF